MFNPPLFIITPLKKPLASRSFFRVLVGIVRHYQLRKDLYNIGVSYLSWSLHYLNTTKVFHNLQYYTGFFHLLMLYFKYSKRRDYMEYKLDNLENKGMLDQMLTDKIIHDNLLFGSYDWKWTRWVRS